MVSTVFTGLLAAAALTAASPLKAPLQTRQNTPSGSHVWRVQDLTLRKYNGRDLNTVTFNLRSTTDRDTNAINCSPYYLNNRTRVPDTNFRENTLYRCSPESNFEYTYSQDGSRLLIRETEDTVTIGTTAVPSTCRIEGSSSSDQVCTQSADAYVVLANYDDYRCQIRVGGAVSEEDGDNDNDNDDDNDAADNDNDAADNDNDAADNDNDNDNDNSNDGDDAENGDAEGDNGDDEDD